MGIRCFVALELPDDLKRNIHDQTTELRATSRAVKWVSEQNLHITLKFLGNTDEAQISGIEAALIQAASAHKRFTVSFEGLGAFPDHKRPRVFWIGERGAEPLVKLQKDVETALAALGFAPEERAFKPHLTIGRAKDIRPIDARKLADYMEKSPSAKYGEMVVSGICLMKSDLRPQGPIYTRLASAQLAQ